MGNQIQVMKLTRSKQFKANSVIVITGATSGIGRELALQYATRDTRLLLAARSEEQLKEVTQQCNQLGSTTNYMKCDVSVESDCEQKFILMQRNLIKECIRLYHRLDVLILNAGVNTHQYFEDMKDFSLFRKIMDTNFYGYVYCTRYALPFLRQSSGQILVLSSLSGEVGLPSRVPYCSSKFAITGFFEALRTELTDFNVAITIVCPPSVATPMRDHDLMQDQSGRHLNLVQDDRTSTEEAVKIIMDAADRRARKIFFPFKAYLAVYVRPFLPDLVDRIFRDKARL